MKGYKAGVDNRKPNTYEQVNASIGYEGKGQPEADYQVKSGEFTVDSKGENYTISFKLTLENGKSLTGNYAGKIIHITP